MAFAKWIGAFLGLLSGGAFGAIAGYALGYIVDDFISNGNQLTSGEQEPFSQQRRTTYTRRTTRRKASATVTSSPCFSSRLTSS